MLEIDIPRQGVAQSPHVGYGSCVNLDIHSIPGIVQLNKKMFKESGTTVTAKPLWAVKNPTNNAQIYVLDSGGAVYQSLDTGDTWIKLGGNSTTSAHGNGMTIWKDYLIVARDTALDTFGTLTGVTFTITIASPGVVSSTAHGLNDGDRVILYTTGALPTGLTSGTVYYVVNKAADTFQLSLTAGGAAINTSGSQSGTHTFKAWKTGIETIDSDVLWHPMYLSKNDDKLYGGAGKYVFSIEEKAGQAFDPGDEATTYTFTQQAIDLPANYRIKCLEELGNNLMIGTWQGTNIYDFRIADIFPWDRSSVSFGQPIIMAEYGIHAMLNTGNSLVVLAGVSGAVYRSDGSNTYKIAQLPIDLYSTGAEKYLEWYPNGIANFKDKIYVSVGNSGTSSDLTTATGIGTYSILQIGSGTILTLEHTINLLTVGTSVPLQIPVLLPVTKDRLLQAYQNDVASGSPTYGIEITSVSSFTYLSDFAAYFETPLYPLSTHHGKISFKEAEFFFAKELATGEGIKLEYRVNLTDSYTTIGSYSHAELGAVTSHAIVMNLPSCEMIQFKISLSNYLGSLGGTGTPQLRKVIIR